MADAEARPGDLSWRLSSHPVTLVTFLAFRISSLLVYILGWLITRNFVLIFILTLLLLSADFYYLKNIAGRRLVGLRWWNEVDTATGDARWVFESPPEGRAPNRTDARFFWIALYAQPAWWVLLAVWSVLTLKVTWLTIIAVALVLTITNTVAFSKCDRFSHASNLASSAFQSSGIARNVAGSMFSRFFSR